MAEQRRFLSAAGVPIALRRRQHSASCRELAVRGPRLQLRSLSAVTSAVWLAAYGLFALSENSMVLSAAIFITLIGLIIYLHFVKIDQESLLVIGSLGIQVTSSYASGKESTTFIEMAQVKDVVINEAIHMQKVIYYLCILLQDPEDPQGVSEVVPLFQFCFHGNNLSTGRVDSSRKEELQATIGLLDRSVQKLSRDPGAEEDSSSIK
uniref:Phosphatidylinositol glycan anchor biosynthesis class H n=1 Tax=Taeniopygia guttata TaxID=59729 RepID=H0ZMN5_TAEGU